MTFGNLTFSHHAPSTEAERQILSLQAALTMLAPPNVPFPSLKKLLRLKKAMQKNKLRKYTFDLTPVKQPEAAPLLVKVQEASDRLDLIKSVIESVTGFSTKTSEVKLASSGHRILHLTLQGESDLAVSLEVVKATVAKRVLADHRGEIPSFIFQSCTSLKSDTTTTISVQCVYKVRNA